MIYFQNFKKEPPDSFVGGGVNTHYMLLPLYFPVLYYHLTHSYSLAMMCLFFTAVAAHQDKLTRNNDKIIYKFVLCQTFAYFSLFKTKKN